MLKRRKTTQVINQDNMLSVRAAEGALQRTFDADVVQSFRYMSTELTLNRDLPRRVAVIAALRGEGVTHTSVALGLTLANDTGARVCVVELNWWAPGLIALLDPRTAEDGPKKKRRKNNDAPPIIPASPTSPAYLGLAPVLAGEAKLADVLLHTDRPNLDLLPAGNMPIPRRPPTARSAALRELLDELSTRYDNLILDVPAVRTTSDAIALASLSDACIIVSRQGVTSTTSVQQALDDVKSLTMLGVVLNKVSIETPRWILSIIPQE